MLSRFASIGIGSVETSNPDVGLGGDVGDITSASSSYGLAQHDVTRKQFGKIRRFVHRLSLTDTL